MVQRILLDPSLLQKKKKKKGERKGTMRLSMFLSFFLHRFTRSCPPKILRIRPPMLATKRRAPFLCKMPSPGVRRVPKRIKQRDLHLHFLRGRFLLLIALRYLPVGKPGAAAAWTCFCSFPSFRSVFPSMQWRSSIVGDGAPAYSLCAS